MYSQILKVEKDYTLRELLEKRSTWLFLYALMALVFEFFLYSPQRDVLFYPGSGLVLAALLILPKCYLYDIKLFLGLFSIDFIIKIYIQQYEIATAIWLALAFLLQAWLGAYLLYKYSQGSIIPNTYKGVFGFLLLGCLIPTLCTNNISAFIYWLDGGDYIGQWLIWTSHRALSIVLITPFLLFFSEFIKHDNKLDISISAYFVYAAICFATIFTFLIANPDGHELTTYGFLLIPIFALCAVRYSLVFNSFVSLSVGLIILWCFDYNVSFNSFEYKWTDIFTLSVFVFANQCMLLLVSAVMSERKNALVRAQKMSQMYEMISNVNQMLVSMKSSEIELFKDLCNIITRESDVSQACISLVDNDSCSRSFRSVDCSNCSIKNIKGCNVEGSFCIVSNKDKNCIINNIENSDVDVSGCACLKLGHDFKTVENYNLYKQGKNFAVLSMFYSDIHYLDDDMRQLFGNMAKDISFALDVLAGRMQLQIISEAFEYSKEAIVITHKDGEVIKVNPSFTAITGFSAEEIVGKNARILKSGRESREFYKELWETIISKGHWTGELRNKKKDGELCVQRGTISSVKSHDGQVKHLISIMEDVTEQKQYEQQILRLANFDILTGLSNRKMLQSQFEWKLSKVQKKNKLAVLFIDLDEFKHINDAYGHQFGDLLLVAVAERIRSFISSGDILSRFGGDEFVLLYEGVGHSIGHFSDELIDVVSKPYHISGQKVSISCSIGISISPTDSNSLNELIGFADAAMYESKSIGRSTFSFYLPYMRTRAIEKVKLKHELEDAVRYNQFVLFYQPKVNVNTNEVIGFEALVRWQHPQRGLLAPGEFISMAEESGQIISIDRWVLEAVIIQINEWKKFKLPLFPISLNLSLSIFTDSKFIDFLGDILDEYDVAANLIDLELTERVAMVDFEYTMRTLNSLKHLGVNISIDDFGTGYSSLAYLRDFPIDTLKIDRAFISDVHIDKKNQGIVSAILAIAETMGLDVVAEGVENEQELNYLKKYGCKFYQGYFYSKPVSVKDMESRLLMVENVDQDSNLQCVEY